MARRRREAEEREKELRAIWAARDRETLSGGAIPAADDPEKRRNEINRMVARCTQR
jgi:hypothetical protein